MINNMRSENFWTAIIWSIIFMVVLVWDQEKIVVLNLVLFCYFIKYMAGSPIDSSLAQRRQLLEEALLTDISHMLVTIRNLRTESLEGSKKLNVVILGLLNKFVFGLLNTKSQFIQYDSLTSLDFSEVQLLLQTAQNDLSSKSVQSTLLVTKEVLTDVLPILETDSEVLEIN